MATMRYLSDVTNGLMLLALLGMLTLYSRVRHVGWARWLVAGGHVTLVLMTLGYGLIFGYQGYTGHFAQFNPKLDRKLVKALSTCPADPTVTPH
jgi:hypothetical protein